MNLFNLIQVLTKRGYKITWSDKYLQVTDRRRERQGESDAVMSYDIWHGERTAVQILEDLVGIKAEDVQ